MNETRRVNPRIERQIPGANSGNGIHGGTGARLVLEFRSQSDSQELRHRHGGRAGVERMVSQETDTARMYAGITGACEVV